MLLRLLTLFLALGPFVALSAAPENAMAPLMRLYSELVSEELPSPGRVVQWAIQQIQSKPRNGDARRGVLQRRCLLIFAEGDQCALDDVDLNLLREELGYPKDANLKDVIQSACAKIKQQSLKAKRRKSPGNAPRRDYQLDGRKNGQSSVALVAGPRRALRATEQVQPPLASPSPLLAPEEEVQLKECLGDISHWKNIEFNPNRWAFRFLQEVAMSAAIGNVKLPTNASELAQHILSQRSRLEGLRYQLERVEEWKNALQAAALRPNSGELLFKIAECMEAPRRPAARPASLPHSSDLGELEAEFFQLRETLGLGSQVTSILWVASASVVATETLEKLLKDAFDAIRGIIGTAFGNESDDGEMVQALVDSIYYEIFGDNR